MLEPLTLLFFFDAISLFSLAFFASWRENRSFLQPGAALERVSVEAWKRLGMQDGFAAPFRTHPRIYAFTHLLVGPAVRWTGGEED